MSRARKQKTEMNGNSLGVVLSPGGLAAAERSGGERSEPQRSAAAAKAGADSLAASRPRRSVLVSADLLAARAGQRHPRSVDSPATRAEVQAQSPGRGSPKTSPPECALYRRSA